MEALEINLCWHFTELVWCLGWWRWRNRERWRDEAAGQQITNKILMNVSNTTKILMLMWTKPYVELQLCLWWLVLASSLRYTAVWFCLAESTSPLSETTYSEVSISKTQPTTQPSGGWRVFLSRAETCISTSHRGFFYSSCFGLGISQKPTQRSNIKGALCGIYQDPLSESIDYFLWTCCYWCVITWQ